MKNSGGIYKIRNLVTNHIYIGSARNFTFRWKTHTRSLRRESHYNHILQNAWNKYGEENFVFEILEVVENEAKLISREQWFIDFYTPYRRDIGYNILKKAGSTLGYKHTKKTKERNSKLHKGKIITIKHRLAISEKVSGDKNPMYGKRHSELTKQKLRGFRAKITGEKNPSAKINEIIVREIRREYVENKVKQVDLAKKYGVNQQSISNILLKKTWKFV